MKSVGVSPTNQIFEYMTGLSDGESIGEIVDNSIGKAYESNKSSVSIDVNYSGDTLEITDDSGGISRENMKGLFTLGESTLDSKSATQ